MLIGLIILATFLYLLCWHQVVRIRQLKHEHESVMQLLEIARSDVEFYSTSTNELEHIAAELDIVIVDNLRLRSKLREYEQYLVELGFEMPDEPDIITHTLPDGTTYRTLEDSE